METAIAEVRYQPARPNWSEGTGPALRALRVFLAKLTRRFQWKLERWDALACKSAKDSDLRTPADYSAHAAARPASALEAKATALRYHERRAFAGGVHTQDWSSQ